MEKIFDERLNQMEERFDKFDERFNQMEERFDRIEEILLKKSKEEPQNQNAYQGYPIPFFPIIPSAYFLNNGMPQNMPQYSFNPNINIFHH